MKTVAAGALASFCLLGLAGCDTADLPVAAHTKDWLHDSNGDVLRFRQPATGARDSMRVELTDNNVWRANTKFGLGGYHDQHIVVKYRMGQPFPNRVVPVYPGLELYFQSNSILGFRLPAGNYAVAQLTTSPDPANEQATGSYEAAAELLHSVTLNGHLYPHIFHLHVSQPPPPQAPEDFWYSREDGLVAYALPNSQPWYRL